MNLFRLLVSYWRGSKEGRFTLLLNLPIAVYNLLMLGNYLRRAISGEEFSFWELTIITSMHLGLASFTFLFMVHMAKKDRMYRSLHALSVARRECWEFLWDETSTVKSAYPAPLGWEETARRLEAVEKA